MGQNRKKTLLLQKIYHDEISTPNEREISTILRLEHVIQPGRMKIILPIFDPSFETGSKILSKKT